MHRQNVHNVGAMIDLAVDSGADRLEVAHTQYYGWALKNRAMLMPSQEQLNAATEVVMEARKRLEGRLVIDYVVPDYYARYPKPCVGGWARTGLNMTPSGKVLPCQAAESITTLTFDNVKDKSLRGIWISGEAFRAYRGTDWMEEPCRSCDRREPD